MQINDTLYFKFVCCSGCVRYLLIPTIANQKVMLSPSDKDICTTKKTLRCDATVSFCCIEAFPLSYFIAELELIHSNRIAVR